MIEHYDRDGRRIGMFAWARLMEQDGYKRIGFDEVGPLHVSTVWLGLDHGFGDGPPMIFETMIFDTRDKLVTPFGTFDESTDCWRYPTEASALAGHDQAVMVARERVSA